MRNVFTRLSKFHFDISARVVRFISSPISLTATARPQSSSLLASLSPPPSSPRCVRRVSVRFLPRSKMAPVVVMNCYVGIDRGQLSIDQLHYGVPSKWDSRAANTSQFISVPESMAHVLKALFGLPPAFSYPPTPDPLLLLCGLAPAPPGPDHQTI